MSKVSVFKFNLNEDERTINAVKQIIGNYLNSRGFYYNNEKQCYMTGKPTNQENIKNTAVNMAGSFIATAATGRVIAMSTNSIRRGFECQILGNQLIIKAYLINNINTKQFIHSTFNNSKAGSYYYRDLEANLFNNLSKNNVVLVSKKVEKINDGSEHKTFINVLICLLLMILLLVGLFFIMKKNLN